MAKKKRTNPRRVPATMADVQKAKKQAVHDAFMINVLFAAMSAHDVFDFGPARIERLVLNMLRKLNDWDEGLFDIEDACEWFESYTGMRLEERE